MGISCIFRVYGGYVKKQPEKLVAILIGYVCDLPDYRSEVMVFAVC